VRLVHSVYLGVLDALLGVWDIQCHGCFDSAMRILYLDEYRVSPFPNYTAVQVWLTDLTLVAGAHRHSDCCGVLVLQIVHGSLELRVSYNLTTTKRRRLSRA
jgi:hypothetical protein